MNADAANAIIAATNAEPIVLENTGKEAAAEKTVSRRALFSSIFSQSKSVAIKAVKKDAKQDDGLLYRRLLHNQAHAAREANTLSGRLHIVLPAVTDACWGCGTCARICPQNAIEIGPLKCDTRRIYLTPWKCGLCGLCEHVCAHGGIKGQSMFQMDDLQKVYVLDAKAELCETCGKPIRPGTRMCPGCLSSELRNSQ
jgi:formate hydrogenlyase subunit 6/NADH:ubiquinone oxidoreductase subunit I